MKGVVFREFLEHLDRTHGVEATEAVIDASGLEHGGAFVSTGYYPAAEMQRMVAAACRHVGRSPDTVLRAFGADLGGVFAVEHRRYFDAAGDLFEFLAQVDRHIHVEVRALYPDAELPRFDIEARDAERMTLIYRSSRRLHDLAAGLIHAAARHYGETVSVAVEPLDAQTGTARITVARCAP